MDLKTFLFSMPMPERIKFALRCKSTYGHVRNVAYGQKSCSAELAMEIERESSGKVLCETLCPGASWSTVRGTRSRPLRKRAA